MKKEISLEERKQIQLEMLEEIHAFCKSHEIRYSLAYGTLIGAIRHKGFIPWDDDVDIMMPLPDMLRFKKEFQSTKLKYLDVDTEKHYEYGFSRIGYNATFCKTGMFGKSYGVNIDLYPIISLPENEEIRNDFFTKASKLINVRLSYIKLRSRIMKILPVNTIPGYDQSIRKFRDFILYPGIQYGSSSLFFVVAGPLNKEEIELCTYHKDLFTDIIEVNFENLKLYAVSCYDEFLTHYYGDYMTPPPIEQRVPYHGGHYYWK